MATIKADIKFNVNDKDFVFGIVADPANVKKTDILMGINKVRMFLDTYDADPDALIGAMRSYVGVSAPVVAPVVQAPETTTVQTPTLPIPLVQTPEPPTPTVQAPPKDDKSWRHDKGSMSQTCMIDDTLIGQRDGVRYQWTNRQGGLWCLPRKGSRLDTMVINFNPPAGNVTPIVPKPAVPAHTVYAGNGQMESKPVSKPSRTIVKTGPVDFGGRTIIMTLYSDDTIETQLIPVYTAPMVQAEAIC